MEFIILLSIALIAIFACRLYDNSNKKDSNNNYHTRGHNNIWLESKKGFTKFQMVGMYYRGLRKSDMGKFEGYAKTEKHNAHDPFAVAIYNNRGKHLGYLSKGNLSIHKLISDNGGSLPAYGIISCDYTGGDFKGEVAVKTNIALDTNNPFYDQTIFILGRFDIPQKDLADKLKNMGAYISSSISEYTDIVLIGEKIKTPEKLVTIESLLKKGHQIKTIKNDELFKLLESKIQNPI